MFASSLLDFYTGIRIQEAAPIISAGVFLTQILWTPIWCLIIALK
jgi:hypothetical protein